MTLTNPVAALRHDLRTPVNHIVGYAEMLIEDLEGESHTAQRAALETAISAAREVLTLISAVLAPTRETVEEADLAALYARITEPQRRIIDAVRTLLAASSEPPTKTFVADLQRILDAAGNLVPQSRVAAASAPAPTTGAGEILIVDDEEGNRDLLRRRLERNGYAAIEATSGEEALAIVARQPVDLVLLDMLMPGLDGHAVLERLKADPGTRDIPVIMVSALDSLQEIAKCIRAGAEDYLPKPFDPIILKARIAGSLARKRWRDQEQEVVRAIGVVTTAASAVEEGTYQPGQLADIAQRQDAVGRLARVMDRMATEVQDRETRLRGRLQELRSEMHAVAPGRAALANEAGITLQEGETFAGRYRVERLIGRGAMGTVYLAHDVELSDDVALKCLKPELVADATSRERFKEEIRLARRITHRNVVRTHDFGEASNVWYLTMEYVEGMTVRSLLDSRGRLSVPSTIAIALQLAQALEVAHAVGVIHRDIKPENLLLDTTGALKVMDFGVARLAESAAAVTEALVIAGTPAYMPPEQLTGDAVDTRADLYASGAVIYECLTGRTPHQGASMTEFFRRVLGDAPPSVIDLAPEVPRALNDLVMQLLAKRVEDRVPSAAVLGERLQALG
ncbi:MAG: protein kinase [Acidobacteriota bacterium]|nr:protein kinase [Acidobacteriota bacterium]